MRWALGCLLALLLVKCAATERMVDAYEDEFVDAEYDPEYEDDENDIPFAPALNKLAAKVQRAVDSQGVLRARRYGNIANGVLLGATGSVTLLASVFGLQLSRVVLSIYMAAAGTLLAGVELGVAPVAGWTKENLNWLTSHSGKTALLFFAGGLSWAFGKAGIVPALLTCANGLFNLKFRSVLGFISADERSGFKEPMHMHEEPMPMHEEPIPMHEEPIPMHEEPMPMHEEPIPMHEEPMHMHEEPMPMHEEPIPMHEEATSEHPMPEPELASGYAQWQQSEDEEAPVPLEPEGFEQDMPLPNKDAQ